MSRTTTNYFIGKGVLRIAARDASGNPGALRDVGEVLISCEVSKDYKENEYTGNAINETDAEVAVKQSLKGTITLKEPTAQNLELILHGKKTVNAGGAVTAQAFPAGIVAGETYRLPGFTGKASALSIVDSAVGPATLAAGTDYTVDLTYGTVTFLVVTGKTQPFKASFTNAASTRSSILAKAVAAQFLRFEGINIGNNDGAHTFIDEFYNCNLKPAKKFDPKGEDYATYEIDFTALADPTRADPTRAEDAEFGRYGNRLILD
jgi:hypothetical protein